jgi:hypothetical protein
MEKQYKGSKSTAVQSDAIYRPRLVPPAFSKLAWQLGDGMWRSTRIQSPGKLRPWSRVDVKVILTPSFIFYIENH